LLRECATFDAGGIYIKKNIFFILLIIMAMVFVSSKKYQKIIFSRTVLLCL